MKNHFIIPDFNLHEIFNLQCEFFYDSMICILAGMISIPAGLLYGINYNEARKMKSQFFTLVFFYLHATFLACSKLLGGWRSAGRREGVKNVLKVSELNHSVKKKGHTSRACMENMKCGEVGRSRVWRRSGKSSEI